MNGDDEEATKKVVRRSNAGAPTSSKTPKPPTVPVYGTPPGSHPALPVYGSRESLTPAEPTRHDFDPHAEERAVAAAAAAAAREARAAEAARAATARSQKRAAEKAAKRAAKRAAARAAYAEKKERTARIAEATRRARQQRRNVSGSISYSKQRSRRAMSQTTTARAPEIGRTTQSARKLGIGPKLLLAALLIAGAILVPIVVTNNSPSSPTVSDGVDWAEYPGRYSDDASTTLAGPRREEAAADNTALLAEVRAAVENELAVSWIEHGTATEQPLENRWGGPSLLTDWESPRWYTTEEISDTELKRRIVESVRDVLTDHGFDEARLLNDPQTSSWTAESLKRMYGSTNPENQVVWELRASRFDDLLTDFQLTITDLSKDKSGEFTKDAQRDEEHLGRPVSSMAMTLTTHGVLATDDEAEFRERAAPFEDKKPPRSSPNG